MNTQSNELEYMVNCYKYKNRNTLMDYDDIQLTSHSLYKVNEIIRRLLPRLENIYFYIIYKRC